MRPWSLAVALLVLFGGAASARASVIPSKADTSEPTSAREADLSKVQTLLDRQEVRAALVAHGLPPGQVEDRLAKLTTGDLRSLASHVDQVQAAGYVPNYIWILLAILIAVTILATV